jgi:hypothetical protein
VELSPALLNFGSVALGSQAVLPLTLTNVGKTTVSFTSITANTDYTSTSNCVASVAAGRTCTINVTFTPSSSGPRPGALSVTSSDPASPERVDLVGQGLGVVLTPTHLAFGSQTVGTTSAPQTVTITNRNTATIVVGTVNATDDYIVAANNCSATLGPGQSCTVQIKFAPDETGPSPGTLFINDSDPNSPQQLPMSGTGK